MNFKETATINLLLALEVRNSRSQGKVTVLLPGFSSDHPQDTHFPKTQQVSALWRDEPFLQEKTMNWKLMMDLS